MTRTAIYARVSTRDKGQDTENQLIDLREFAARNNWTVVEEYVDHATGSRGDRDHFQRLFADASAGKFEMVLFWSLDRFSREGALETLQHLQRLTNNKVDWFSLKEEYLRSVGIFRDAVLAILATIAKQERLRLSERTKAGLARARAEGKRLGRPKNIFRRDKVRELRAEGKSIRAIAAELGIAKMTVQRELVAGVDL